MEAAVSKENEDVAENGGNDIKQSKNKEKQRGHVSNWRKFVPPPDGLRDVVYLMCSLSLAPLERVSSIYRVVCIYLGFSF